MLKNELGAAVQVFDPFRHVANAGKVNAESTGPAYAVAVGLAMRQDEK
jgi:Tfp pilus assembly PilM family ATPase